MLRQYLQFTHFQVVLGWPHQSVEVGEPHNVGRINRIVFECRETQHNTMTTALKTSSEWRFASSEEDISIYNATAHRLTRWHCLGRESLHLAAISANFQVLELHSMTVFFDCHHTSTDAYRQFSIDRSRNRFRRSSGKYLSQSQIEEQSSWLAKTHSRSSNHGTVCDFWGATLDMAYTFVTTSDWEILTKRWNSARTSLAWICLDHALL